MLDNDRAGHLLGELWLGAARGVSDAVFLAVGTGIGAGILSGGRILRGAHGIAGAAGWMCLDDSWREEYARAGCYEWLAAGPALARMAGAATGLALEAEAVVASARAGEEWACRLVDELARIHGRAVANLVSLLDPEVVVLGGLFSDAARFLEGIEREIVRRRSRWPRAPSGWPPPNSAPTPACSARPAWRRGIIRSRYSSPRTSPASRGITTPESSRPSRRPSQSVAGARERASCLAGKAHRRRFGRHASVRAGGGADRRAVAIPP